MRWGRCQREKIHFPNSPKIWTFDCNCIIILTCIYFDWMRKSMDESALGAQFACESSRAAAAVTAEWCKHVLNKIYDAVDHIIHCVLWARARLPVTSDQQPPTTKNGNIGLLKLSGLIRYADINKCEKLYLKSSSKATIVCVDCLISMWPKSILRRRWHYVGVGEFSWKKKQHEHQSNWLMRNNARWVPSGLRRQHWPGSVMSFWAWFLLFLFVCASPVLSQSNTNKIRESLATAQNH